MSSAPAPAPDAPSRIRPSFAVAVGVWIAYTVVAVGVQASSGIAYADWFKTAANAWRTGVLSLAAGSVLLAAFIVVARWNHLWREPVRLTTTRLMKAALILWWAAIFLRFAGVRWNEVPLDLLAAIVATGVLVGFAEEILFRGIVLRGLREGGGSEAVAVVWTSVCFGLLHLPNLFMGTGWIGIVQIVAATASGALLYAFRRATGVLWPAMVAHGAWDISTFVAGGYAAPWLEFAALPSLILFAVLGFAVLGSVWRNDRGTAVIPAAAG